MTAVTESTLRLTFPSDAKARKFDDQSHGLSHCMKAVDFIIDEPHRVLFVEVKDPGHPGARPENRDEFVRSFLSGAIDQDLTLKFRDSSLYEWACGNMKKPVYYWVIVAIETLDDAALLARSEALQKRIPERGPASGRWKRQIAAGCMVFNMRTWNQSLPQDYRVARLLP